MEMCNLDISNEFSSEEINQTAQSNRLLTIEIEPTIKCNYKCTYCYASHDSSIEPELSFEEIKDIIFQAKELGAKKVILLGGEPTIYPKFKQIVEFIFNEGLKTEVFSNGSMITSEMADYLYKFNAGVVIKLNSLKPEIMEKLTGRSDSLKNALRAIELLKEAGYPDKAHLLGASAIISQYNYDEITELWKWLKDRNISPYFEMITPQGRAKENDELFIEPLNVEKLFNELSQIDSELYGNKWIPQPPLVANKCLRNMYSCTVDSYGHVKPCVGINIVCGNIRKRKLSDIIRDSGVIQDLRNYRERLRGPCKQCDRISECYGCRGAAFQMTGEPLASDPLCWKNQDKLDKIYSLPFPAAKILPQKGKMKMVDTLEEIKDRTSIVTAKIKADNPFIDENGVLSEAAYLELIAQGIAATNGFYALENDLTHGIGFIIGAKKIINYGTVKVGDKLTISVRKDVDLGDFGTVYGEIFCNDAIIAEGELKLWGKSY